MVQNRVPSGGERERGRKLSGRDRVLDSISKLDEVLRKAPLNQQERDYILRMFGIGFEHPYARGDILDRVAHWGETPRNVEQPQEERVGDASERGIAVVRQRLEDAKRYPDEQVVRIVEGLSRSIDARDTVPDSRRPEIAEYREERLRDDPQVPIAMILYALRVTDKGNRLAVDDISDRMGNWRSDGSRAVYKNVVSLPFEDGGGLTIEAERERYEAARGIRPRHASYLYSARVSVMRPARQRDPQDIFIPSR